MREGPPELHRWENLGHQVGTFAVHARIGGCDDRNLGRVDIGFQ